MAETATLEESPVKEAPHRLRLRLQVAPPVAPDDLAEGEPAELVEKLNVPLPVIMFEEIAEQPDEEAIPGTPVRAPSTAAPIPEVEVEATADCESMFISLVRQTSALEKTVDGQELRSQVLEELRTFEHLHIEEPEEASEITALLDKEIERSALSAFYVVNLATVVAKYQQWQDVIPRARPHYAVKCNPLEGIARTLYACGAGFDCASLPEMQQVLDMGCPPEDIIFANPCKMTQHLEFAHAHGIRKTTFDNLGELQKIQKALPDAEAVIRILPPMAAAACNFGSKFGAPEGRCLALLTKAKELGVQIIGVSFHVGSGCYDPNAFIAALNSARRVFDMGLGLGHPMRLLDLGGGWPGTDGQEEAEKFATMATVAGKCVDELFPPEVEVIAEPGRYFASECCTLAVNVIAKREPEEEDTAEGEVPRTLYYLSDGVYGSFNNIFFDHAHVDPKLLHPQRVAARGSVPLERSTLFGPTCDSIDMVCSDVCLPELEEGDWLYFLNMGAYTSAAASNFNGFRSPAVHYVYL
eukprot:CAMPEP_0114552644 /NCGR_PEP_ID=MMETSP0114-20121206/7232_1 /TAXON_ID=31324 /ORGANISM="Goniomonas sp, Strain m" /LENGTH=525 /DNA_ID=CAMNT_0001737529 /DNA_START=31 /DNA_END=1608 /DNA_ORIENTATION=+